MKVHELHAFLADHMSYGRGDDEVYVYPRDMEDAGGDDGPGEQMFRSTDWAVVDMEWADDRDAFVTLHIAPQKETTT